MHLQDLWVCCSHPVLLVHCKLYSGCCMLPLTIYKFLISSLSHWDLSIGSFKRRELKCFQADFTVSAVSPKALQAQSIIILNEETSNGY